MRKLLAVFALLLLPLRAHGYPGSYAGWIYPPLSGSCGNACYGASGISADWIVIDPNDSGVGKLQIIGQWIGLQSNTNTGGGSTNHCPGVSCLGQFGTASQWKSGVKTYQAWYELACNSCQPIQWIDADSFPVAAGDHIHANMTCTANCADNNPMQKWRLTLQNVTQGWTWDNNGNDLTWPLAAGWVHFAGEALASNSKPPSFSPTPFFNAQVNGLNATFTTPNLQQGHQNTTNGGSRTIFGSSPINGGNSFFLCYSTGTWSSSSSTCLPSPLQLELDAVFSTSLSSSQSFLRFVNTGTTAGTVTVILSDYATGQFLGQWTSPSIPPNAAPQYSIGNIEYSPGQNFTKPSFYSISVRSDIAGYMQHVLWNPADGALTNLSTCDAGVTTNPTTLNNVHASTIDYGYPSSIIVNNTGTSAETVMLGIYGAVDGIKLGTYTTDDIPAGGETILAMRTIEAAANITPGSAGNHYMIKAEAPFTGYLQHLVNNIQPNVITDMTNVCALSGASPPGGLSPLHVGTVFSTSLSSSQSFLRFVNTGTTAGTVTVTLSDYATGQFLGQWTSPSIPPNAAPQYSIGNIEYSPGQNFTKPSFYSISVRSDIAGYMQHVLWNPADGALTNLSTCDAGVTTNPTTLNNVHASPIDYGYPSSIIVNNTGTSAETVMLGIYGAVDGIKLGTYTTAPISAGGGAMIAMRTIEAAINITPGSAGNHYMIKAEGPFTGYLKHLVKNIQPNVITDMTTVCALPGPTS